MLVKQSAQKSMQRTLQRRRGRRRRFLTNCQATAAYVCVRVCVCTCICMCFQCPPALQQILRSTLAQSTDTPTPTLDSHLLFDKKLHISTSPFLLPLLLQPPSGVFLILPFYLVCVCTCVSVCNPSKGIVGNTFTHI